MFDIVDSYTKSYTDYEFNLSYATYLEALTSNLDTPQMSYVDFKFFQEVFKRMLDVKKECINKADWLYLLTQLLTGIRACEYKHLKTAVNKIYVTIEVNSAKGSRNRYLKYLISHPFIKTYAHLAQSDLIRPSYKAYYRTLYNSAPNFFKVVDTPHLTATHILRHFVVQSLYYVCNYNERYISDWMGWYNDDTIKNYTDKKIWRY